MKEFYKWWKGASQEWNDEYNAYEGWKAALKWVLNSVCSEQDGYRAHLIAEDIKEELNEN